MKNLIYLVVMVAATSCASGKLSSNTQIAGVDAKSSQTNQIAHTQIKDAAAERNVMLHSFRH